MMVETMLESSQDFGMSNGALPQWKRELLQRRAARSRPAPPAHPPPPPPAPAPAPAPAPPPDDDDEELRYGPGIVKRLKSRYLSLALRDAPRRRPSVLRRAASLEHLLDERPPPAPRPPSARPPRPASVAAPPATLAPPLRREYVKRARSVDALSRLDARDEPHPPSPSPPPPHAPAPALAPPPQAPPPPPAPRPPVARSARPPRRPTPLLRDTERPPPDVVRSALRKFESAPTRRPAPAARVSAVLRGLEGPSRTSTPEPREQPPPAPRSPTPPPVEAVAPVSVSTDEPEGPVASVEARPVSRAALEGIARAGSSMRFAFEAPRRGSHLPPLAATNPVLVGRARRVGVIRPMPAPPRSPDPAADLDQKFASPPSTPRLSSPPPMESELSPIRHERKDTLPAAMVEPIPRSSPEDRAASPRPESPREPDPESTDLKPKIEKIERPLTNGHADSKPSAEEPLSRLGGADIERAWNGSSGKKVLVELKDKKVVETREAKGGVAPWAGGGGGEGSPLHARRPRAPPPAATSIVFNFSNRKEVPDYIENDGIILRGSRRNRIKPGEPGVVVLRPEALKDEGSSDEEVDAGPPSPCSVRFVNDNVLINGRSSMPARPNRDRTAKLKLQFDDSLTRTFEYPSETSLCEDSPADERAPAPAPAPAPLTSASTPAPASAPAHSTLAANTHIVSAALARYTPAKTVADAFQLGVTRTTPAPAPAAHPDRTKSESESSSSNGGDGGSGDGGGGGEGDGDELDARPCSALAARSWSEARTHTTDLLF